jgi:hypothetical protein
MYGGQSLNTIQARFEPHNGTVLGREKLRGSERIEEGKHDARYECVCVCVCSG